MTMTDQPPTTDAPPEAEPDRPAVEVVERPAALPAPVETPAASALEKATEQFLATPGVPGRDEFLVLATTARLLSMSRGAPKQVRDDPWLALHMALIGRDLGISPSAAIAQIDVIGEGDEAQLAPSPELLNGQIKRLGLGSIVPCRSTEAECIAVALEPGGRIDARCKRTYPEHVEDCGCTIGRILGDYHFTWAEAKQAGLVAAGCQPYEHTTDCLNGGNGTRGKRCRQGYRTYPKRMMWWRCAGFCADDYFPEASIGLYTPEELGAVIDPDTGRMIDPSTVDLPEGYNPPEVPPDPRDDVVADAGPDTDPDLVRDREDLTARLAAVKAAGTGAVDALRALWEETDEDGRRKTPPWLHERFRRRHLVRARAIVKSIEDRIKRGEWGDEAKGAWADAAVTGAGFGKGSGAKVTGEDFEHGTGRSPHDLARARAAREKAAAEAPAEAPADATEETATASESDAAADVADTAGDATETQDGHEGGQAEATGGDDGPRPLEVDQDDEVRESCLGCGKPVKTTSDGRNHPGPNGRAGSPYRSFHRSCAPFD